MMMATGEHDGAPHNGERGETDHSLLVELVHGRLGGDDAQRLLDRVAADEELSRELDLIILMMDEGTREGRTRRYDQAREQGRTLREASGTGRALLRAAAVVMLLIGGGTLIDAALAPPYAMVAGVGTGDLHLLVRDGSADELAAMRAFLSQGQWEEAARRAEWYLSVHGDGPGRGTAHVNRAAAFLMGARKDVLGFGVRFDRTLVDSAMVALHRARLGAPAPGEVEQIAWLEAKAFLMRGEPGEARTRLQWIIGTGGIYVQDARRILATLDAMR